MTDLRSRLQRALLAVSVLFCTAASSAADDPNNVNNTFNTPGYPAASQRGAGTNGNGEAAESTNTRGLRNNNGSAHQNDGQNTLDERQGRRTELTPPKPGEFQKFVEAATGRLLPIFGSQFFTESADVPMAVENVPVSADYTVGPGDEILLRAWGSIDVDYRSTVDRNGLLNLPKIGSFNVNGVKASELAKYLRTQIGRLYTNFDLSASLGQLRGLRVFVVGPALRPGVFTLPSQSTMLSAVARAGGPGPTGSMRTVLLRRDGKVVSELDIYEFLVHGEKSKDVQLAAGDVIVFQPAGARVALAGALDTPAINELKTAQEPVRDILRYAGGTPTLANPNLAHLERIDSSQPSAARFVEEFKLDATGLQKSLRDGDVLTLLPISPEFANAVTLRGHVAQPLRYPYRPGMRIRDLIPDAAALITPDFYRRKNLLVQVIEDEERPTSDNRSRTVDNNTVRRYGNGANNNTGSTTPARSVNSAARLTDDTTFNRAEAAKNVCARIAP